MERFYEEFMIRELCDRLERQRDLIIAALHGNGMIEKLDEAITSTESSFDQMIEYVKAVAAGEDEAVAGEDIDTESNPFWQGAKRGWDKIDVPRSDESDLDVTAGDLVAGEQSLEEIRAVLRDLDQT